MGDFNNRMNRIGGFLLDAPQRFLREVLENPFKFLVFACLLAVALGELLPKRAKEISAIVSPLQVEALIFLVFGVFVLAKKNEDILFPKGDAASKRESVELFGRRFSYGAMAVVALMLICSGAFAIRLWDLAALDPYTDENAHLTEAIGFLRGDGKTYSRSRFVSGLVYLAWEMASPNDYKAYVYWSRVPSVVAGALTVFPLYLVASRISRPIGLLACILWAVSPWAIGVSRYAREYAFYPLVILIVLNSYFRMVELVGRKGPHLLKRILPHAVLLVLFSAAAIVDYKSTLKAGFIVIAAVMMWHLGEVLLSRFTAGVSVQNRLLSYGVVLVAIGAVVTMNLSSIGGLGYNLNPRFLNAFLVASTDAPTMWWSGYGMIERIPSFFIFVACIFSGLKRDRNFFAVFSIFIVLLFFYYLMFDRYFRPRYCYYLLPFFVIVTASGIYHLFRLLSIFRIVAFRMAAGTILVAFLVSVFNVDAVRDSVSTVAKAGEKKGRRSGPFPATGEFHQYFGSTLKFLAGKIDDEDVFVTTIFQPVLSLGFDVPMERIHYFVYRAKDSKKRVARIVEKHDRGWIILDARRHGLLRPAIFPTKKGKPFVVADKTVKLVMSRDEAQIYRWEPSKSQKTVKDRR